MGEAEKCGKRESLSGRNGSWWGMALKMVSSGDAVIEKKWKTRPGFRERARGKTLFTSRLCRL